MHSVKAIDENEFMYDCDYFLLCSVRSVRVVPYDKKLLGNVKFKFTYFFVFCVTRKINENVCFSSFFSEKKLFFFFFVKFTGFAKLAFVKLAFAKLWVNNGRKRVLNEKGLDGSALR